MAADRTPTFLHFFNPFDLYRMDRPVARYFRYRPNVFDPGKPILRFRPERNAAHRSENAPTLPIRTRVTLEKCNSPRIMDGYGKEFVYRLLQVTAAGWYAAVDTKVGRTRNSIRRRAPRWHATFTDIYFWKRVRILYRFRLRENRIWRQLIYSSLRNIFLDIFVYKWDGRIEDCQCVVFIPHEKIALRVYTRLVWIIILKIEYKVGLNFNTRERCV